VNALQALLFGRRPRQAPRVERSPPGVVWNSIRPLASDEPVRAELARASGAIETHRGKLRYQAGKHYIVHYGPGDAAPVRRAIFERTYRRRDDGLYEKSPDIVLRYFTLSYPVIVETLEGPEAAEAGDWIVEGVTGELWPMAARDGAQKYTAA
jgi:hypothetical protein